MICRTYTIFEQANMIHEWGVKLPAGYKAQNPFPPLTLPSVLIYSAERLSNRVQQRFSLHLPLIFFVVPLAKRRESIY